MSLEFLKLKKSAVYQFEHWGEHQDPRFYHYNFPYEHRYEYEAWYYSKQRWLSRKVFGLFLDDYPLGFVTLKNIQWLKKTAELGIAIDPNHLSEGFGTELLKRFLTYVFTTYPITTMQLKVAHFNERAQKSYEKIGFQRVSSKVEMFEEQGYKDIIIARYPELFHMQDGALMTTFHLMAIKKEDFLKK